MDSNSIPQLIIFAGANGSGKTTMAEALLLDRKISEFLNADEMARGLFPFQPDLKKLEAGKLLLARAKHLLDKSESFSIETTLSGRTLVNILKIARQKNYHIEMFYFYTGNVIINTKRIKHRVKQGGHDIPVPDIKRRYYRSLNNFFNIYREFCHTITVMGNGLGFPVVVAYIKDGKSFVANNTLWQKMKMEAEKND